MSGITGAIRPTFRYARIVWNGRTIDFDDPLQEATPPETSPVAGSSTTAGGVRSTLTERLERGVVIVTPQMKPHMCAEIQRFVEEWGAEGEQFECYVDRILRAWWGFDDGTLYDNNRGNAFDWHDNPGTALAYTTLTEGRGFTMPSTGWLRAALVSQLAGGSGNEFFSASEGTLVVQFKPDWAFADSAEHVLVDCGIETAQWKNRLRLVKRADNVLHLTYAGSNGAETIVEAVPAWNANTEHTVMAQWKALTDLKLRVDDTTYTTKKYPIVADAARVAGTGLLAGQVGGVPNGVELAMDDAPEALALGTDLAGRGRATGVMGMLALYTAALELPNVWKTHEHPWRTYYPKGELVDAAYRAIRVGFGTERYQYQFRIRDGKGAST